MSIPSERIEIKPGAIYFERPGYYFGYGLESDPEVMEAIVGHSLVAELGVVAVNRQLYVQEFDQIPNVPIEALGGKSAQENVVEAWKKHTDIPFSSYVLRKSDNRGDVVTGTLFELDIDDATALVEWDLADPDFAKGKGTWRYWDHLIELADGRNYNPFLNEKDVTMRVIKDFVSERQSD